ncbi:MAG TPA: VOC family protein [Bacteroidales bacterium]|nr:VOC family protein [Bacteroidales bacterium]
MQIHHVAVWTADLEMMKDFYVKYFNCIAGELYVNHVKRFSSYFLRFGDGASIELMNRHDVSGPQIKDALGLAHIALNAGSREEVDRLTSFLEKEGVRISGKPRQTGDGYYESVILDPEGNLVEIVSC